MSLPIQSFQQIVDSQVAAMQASSKVVLDFSVGAVLRAIVESNAGNALWLESTAQTLLDVTRLTTSTGNDVDTFVEQFGLTRNPATPATGNVTLSRYTANLQATINVGALVSCVTNGISYSVGIDTGNAYYNSSLNAYILPASIASISVPVTATTAGTVGNVIANQITTIQSVIVNIDSVTNPSAFTNGADAESDEELKIRFVLYLNGLSKATKIALTAAILSVSGVERQELIENEDLAGNVMLGFFYALVDDGTGNASSTLLMNVSSQLDVTRGFTIGFAAYGPTQFPMSFSAHVFTDLSMPDSTVHDAVVAALESYISSQGFDSLFPYSEVPRIIYDTNVTLSGNTYSPITNVTNWTINGGTSDVQLTGQEIPVNGTITITVNA